MASHAWAAGFIGLSNGASVHYVGNNCCRHLATPLRLLLPKAPSPSRINRSSRVKSLSGTTHGLGKPVPVNYWIAQSRCQLEILALVTMVNTRWLLLI